MLDTCPRCGATPLPNSVVCAFDAEVLVAADQDPLLGQQIGTYRVVKRIGVGGMGAVYEAQEVNIDKRAALKIVHPHLGLDPRLPTVLAEAKAVNAIGDAGIVDIYGFGTLPDGRQYLVMELLEGESLEARLGRPPLMPVVEVIDLLTPLLQALEAAHASGFVHKDIKSANVFIVQRPNRAPVPKLLDFGIAQPITVAAPAAVGTPYYVAPEQADNLNVGPKADLYSFGCLTYEALTGRLPFVDPDPMEVVRLQKEAPRPSVKKARPDVPERLDALVTALMAVNPGDRPASAASVRATMLAVREGLMPKPSQAGRYVAAFGAVLAAALIVWVATRPVPSGMPPSAETAIAAAAKAMADDLAKLDGPRAIEALLAAEASFPGRPEWEPHRARITATLRTSVNDAIAQGDASGAETQLAVLARLGPVDKSDPLEVARARLAVALHNGMVRVGAGYVDRYEYPNRAGAVPATKVDWADAVKLCERAGKRLCTEEEWEAACAGSARRPFPYGDALVPGRCLSQRKKVKAPEAAGTRAGCATPEGVADLSGNVAEWTSSPVREGAPQRVIRGGSFGQSDAKLGCGARDYLLPGLGGARHVGFRCCL